MATLPQPHEKLVKVFDTEQESEAMVVKGLLDSEGIDAVVLSLDAPQEVLPGVGGVIIQVREEQAEDARRIIRENYNPDPIDDEQLTIEGSSQPE